MKVTTKNLAETEVVLTVVAEPAELQKIKQHVLRDLSKDVKVAGFRAGKTPPELVEKNINPATLQSQFLDHAINDLYPVAAQEAKIHPVENPQVDIKKFVPFTTLEFTATVQVLGEIKLADYKKIKKAKPTVKVSAKEIDDVINSLRERAAEAKTVERAAKTTDRVTIDFKGVDDKGQAVNGADGKDYPLTLGSNAFIPGFEDNLIGLKADAEKTFTLKFPKDYGVAALANRNVTFTVTVKKVEELEPPALDDAFAASVGPVKTVAELKDDIKKELQAESQRQADLDYQTELVKEIAAKSKIAVPQAMIDEHAQSMLRELQQNLLYRGQTMAEFLKQEGKNEEEYKKQVLEPQAAERVKAGLVLAEVSEQEKLELTQDELNQRIQDLKEQYKDPQMQAELDKPETRREIATRMLSEKTVNTLVAYATK